MDSYEQLQAVLDTHPARAPKTDTFMEILKVLFTPEEAALAATMSFKAKAPGQIAKAAGLDEAAAQSLLDSMAAKTIIHFHEKDGKKKYGLVPTIPGLFEFPFMKGGGTPMHDRLGELWEAYHHEALGNAFAGNPTPLMRVVPVEQSLTPKNRVHPYEEVRNFIMQADFIALTQCACRVSVKGCDRPKDVCLIFDGAGRFLVAAGSARAISKEEGLEVLDRAEKAGLVHTSNNSSDKAGLICNCCPCCCTVLRGRTRLNHPHAFEPSRFEARVDAVSCTGCAVCAEERCPVKAITMNDGIATVDAEHCIGCGLCASACPAQAIGLVDRKVVPGIPATVQEMGITVAKEKGTLEEFIKIMSR